MPTNLDRFVSGSIVRRTRTAVRPNFAMPLIVGYHQLFAELTRTYSELSEMLADGFTDRDPEYLAAQRLVSQTPRVPQWKIGRRSGAPTQSLRFTPATPVQAIKQGLSIYGVPFEFTPGASPTVAQVTAGLVLAINASPTGILATGGATSLSAQVLSGAALNGLFGLGTRVSPPRNLTFVLSSNAHWLLSSIVVTGLSPTGRVITETFAVPAGGNTTLVGTKIFDLSAAGRAALSVAIPIQGGTAGTFTIGTGSKFDDLGHLSILATDNTTTFDVSAVAAGGWYRYSGFSTGMLVEDRTANPGTTLAADLAAIRNADSAWYLANVCDAQSSAQILSAAAWAETELVLLVADTVDTLDATSDASGPAAAIKDLGYLRTKIFHSRVNHGRFFSLGAMSAMLTSDPGSTSIEYKTVIGCEADDFGTAEINRLAGTTLAPTSGKNAGIYLSAIPAGTNVGTPIVWGALVAGGEWLDVVLGLDWSRSDIQIAEFEFQLNNPRVPFTRQGIAALSDIVEARLKVHARAPYNIYDDESIVVTPRAFEDTTAAERQTRRHNGVKWGARVQGAIRALDVSGEVTP